MQAEVCARLHVLPSAFRIENVATKKSPRREDTGRPDSTVAMLCSWQKM
jgi:hypothetical protein